MLEWFRKLSGIRKFVVVWNLVFLPIALWVFTYLIFFSGIPFEQALAGVAIIIVAAALGLTVIWKVTK
jgi:hypothetical protein